MKDRKPAKNILLRMAVITLTMLMCVTCIYPLAAGEHTFTADALAKSSASSLNEEAYPTTSTNLAPAVPGVTVKGLRVPVCIRKGKGFTIKGVIRSEEPITKVYVGAVSSKGKWKFSQTYDVDTTKFNILDIDKDIKFGTLAVGDYTYRVDVLTAGKRSIVIKAPFTVTKSSLKAALLGNPTDSGDARVVYTFSSKNCKKMFSIKGFKNVLVPQAMTFTGKKYYILYGMEQSQGIVTYSAQGKKLKNSAFAFNIGHPNGITWNPKTKRCYIFKGCQTEIYVWNPAKNRYGRTEVPYSSSGIAYDRATGDMYASSVSYIRTYSGDGKFVHKGKFSRCERSYKHHVQDCGAYNGFVFHGISGTDRHNVNYLDVYRTADGKYLGSIRIALGEIESAVVGNDGYLQLLINTPYRTDYIWKTPLNIRDLMN